MENTIYSFNPIYSTYFLLNTKVLLAVFGVLSVLLIWKRRSNPGIEFKGPRKYLFGGWLNLMELANRKRAIKVFTNWSSEYDYPLLEADLGFVSVFILNSPEIIQKIYGSLDMNRLGKPYFYDVFKPATWFDGLLNSKGQKWKTRRKLLTHMLEYRALLSYTHIMSEESINLVERLATMFDGKGTGISKPIDLPIMDASMNCFCKTAFGTDIRDVHCEADIETFIRGSNRYFEIVSKRLTNPWLLLAPLWRLHPLRKEANAYFEFTKGFVRAIIHHCKKNQSVSMEDDDGLLQESGKSLVKDLVNAGLPFDGIYEEIITMIIGGHETTAATLHHLLFFLALNPECQEMCYEEVKSVFADPELAPSGYISSAGLKSLQYLERCILETMRILPPAFVILRTMDAPVQLDENVVLPTDSTVLVSTVGIHMNPKYYPNPDTFDPDRFLPDERHQRHPYSYLPFAAGPRKCLGNKFAMMELLLLSSRIIHHFVIRTTDKFEDVTFLPNMTLTPEKPMNFILEKRPVAV